MIDAAVEEGLLPESVLMLHEQALQRPGADSTSGKKALDQTADLAAFTSAGVPGTGPRQQLFDDLMAPKHLPPPVHLAMLPPPPAQFYSTGPPPTAVPQPAVQPAAAQHIPTGPMAMEGGRDRYERDNGGGSYRDNAYRERDQHRGGGDSGFQRRDNNYDDRRGGSGYSGRGGGGYRERYD